MRIGTTRRLLVGAAAAFLLAAAGSVAAQPYPNKPVRIMVGANAGGGTDIIARMLADKFGESLKQPFVVENRPGASNTIAADLTAQGAARRLHAARRDQHRPGDRAAPLKLGFDPLKQLQPVGLIVVVPERAGRRRQRCRKDVKDAGRAAKAKPGKSGTRPRASAARSTSPARPSTWPRASRRCTCLTRAASQAHVDMIGGQVEMMFDTTSSAMPHIKAGKLPPARGDVAAALGRAAGRADDRRGRLSGAEMTTWYGLFVTGGTPKPIVDKLHAELSACSSCPTCRRSSRASVASPAR